MATPVSEAPALAPFQAKGLAAKQLLSVKAKSSDAAFLMPSLPDHVPSAGRKRPALSQRPTGVTEPPSENETSFLSCMPAHKDLPIRGTPLLESKPRKQFRLKKRPSARLAFDDDDEFFTEYYATATTTTTTTNASKLNRFTTLETPPKDSFSVSSHILLPIM